MAHIGEFSVISPGLTLHAAVSHQDRDREVFWFKYKKNGDFLVQPRIVTGRVGRRSAGSSEEAPPTHYRGIDWLPTSISRRYMTLHPSRPDEPAKRQAVVSGPGGVRPIGLDFRSLDRWRPLMVQRLARPDAYPLIPRGIATLHLGTAFLRGAPEIRFSAVPIDEENKTMGAALPIVDDGGLDLVIGPSKLTERRFLLQIRLTHDATRPFWPMHQLSFPVFEDQAFGEDANSQAPA